jgi:hypothetical protein
MKLNVLERIMLMQILPNEGNYVTFKMLIELKSALTFSEKEYKDLGMAEKDGQITWKKQGTEKEIFIGDKMTEVIKAALKKLDDEGKVNLQFVSLFEKFQYEPIKT